MLGVIPEGASRVAQAGRRNLSDFPFVAHVVSDAPRSKSTGNISYVRHIQVPSYICRIPYGVQCQYLTKKRPTPRRNNNTRCVILPSSPIVILLPKCKQVEWRGNNPSRHHCEQYDIALPTSCYSLSFDMSQYRLLLVHSDQCRTIFGILFQASQWPV
jgi:hypothetical protein